MLARRGQEKQSTARSFTTLLLLDSKQVKCRQNIIGNIGIYYYLQGHYEHQWNGLIKKNKSSFLKPVVVAHYLYTPNDGHYWELGVGLNKFLKVWRVDFYNSWREGKRASSGVRIGMVID